MSRDQYGTYAPLASRLGQGDDIALDSVPTRGAHSPLVNTSVLPPTTLSGTPSDQHVRRSSRPQMSSPLLNSIPQPDNPPNNYSEEELELPSLAHSQEPFVGRNSDPSLPSELDKTQLRALPHHDFNSKRQFWEIFRRGLKQFIRTLIIATLLVYTIWHFSHQKVMSKHMKSVFNAINTGLSMTLGMCVAEGFKSMAVDIRWWILSRKKRSLPEVDKILRADSLMVLGNFAWQKFWSRHLCRDWGLILGIAIWWLVNVAAQVSIAAVGLAYGVDKEGSIAQTTPGNVLLPNMTQIFPIGTPDAGSIEAQQYTANSFGNMALSFQIDSSGNIPEAATLYWSINALFFLEYDQRSWTFVFIDSSPSDPGFANATGGPSAMYTNRKINSTSSCLSYAVIAGGNGTSANLTVQKDSNGDLFKVTLPIVPGLDTTTYVTKPDLTCGEGCSVVDAFETSHTTSWYYQCNITVGNVINGKLPEHEVGISLRQMASAGIALQGYGLNSQLPGSQQFQVYPSASPYGVPQKGDADFMGLNIAMFAIGVVSVDAIYTTHAFNVTGLQPQVGNELKVDHWNFVWMIMGLIVGIQGASFVLTAFWANRVVVKDESVFSTARLLRPVLDELVDNGTTMSGKDICKVLDPGQEKRYIYTVPNERGEPYRVELGAYPRRRCFPEGVYN